MSFQDRRNTLDIWQVDVFTQTPFCGNPAAVVFDADGLSDAQMQAIARETNLSETVFLTTPEAGANFGVRIFTTRREIPFAVHPAIAAAHAYSQAQVGVCDQLVMSCGSGNITLSTRDDAWFAAVPEAKHATSNVTRSQLAGVLGSEEDQFVGSEHIPIWATGPRWLMAQIVSVEALRAITPDHSALAAMTRPTSAVGLTAFAMITDGEDLAELRAFAPAEGIHEDPVCGSCAGALAAMLTQTNPDFATTSPCSFAQGASVLRPGRITVYRPQQALLVGGHSKTIMQGKLLKGMV